MYRSRYNRWWDSLGRKPKRKPMRSLFLLRRFPNIISIFVWVSSSCIYIYIYLSLPLYLLRNLTSKNYNSWKLKRKRSNKNMSASSSRSIFVRKCESASTFFLSFFPLFLALHACIMRSPWCNTEMLSLSYNNIYNAVHSYTHTKTYDRAVSTRRSLMLPVSRFYKLKMILWMRWKTLQPRSFYVFPRKRMDIRSFLKAWFYRFKLHALLFFTNLRIKTLVILYN